MDEHEHNEGMFSAVYVEELQRQLREKDETVAKILIAGEVGLPIRLYDRIEGSNPEEWLADAQDLAKVYQDAHRLAPMGSSEPVMTSNASPASREFFNNISEAFNHNTPGFRDEDGNIWYRVY